jgi:hypothetical protein
VSHSTHRCVDWSYIVVCFSSLPIRKSSQLLSGSPLRSHVRGSAQIRGLA